MFYAKRTGSKVRIKQLRKKYLNGNKWQLFNGWNPLHNYGSDWTMLLKPNVLFQHDSAAAHFSNYTPKSPWIVVLIPVADAHWKDIHYRDNEKMFLI